MLRKVAIVLNSVAIGFCLLSLVRFTNGLVLIALITYALTMTAIVTKQKPAVAGTAAVLCVLLGLFGLFAGTYVLAIPTWYASELSRYLTSFGLFVLVGVTPLLSARVLYQKY